MLFYFDFLYLRAKFLQGAVAINPVGDIVPEAMPHHPFPICFPDAIALAQPAEGMPAGVLRPFRKAQGSQCILHLPAKLRDAPAA